jgi:hypothetical protein
MEEYFKIRMTAQMGRMEFERQSAEGIVALGRRVLVFITRLKALMGDDLEMLDVNSLEGAVRKQVPELRVFYPDALEDFDEDLF